MNSPAQTPEERIAEFAAFLEQELEKQREKYRQGLDRILADIKAEESTESHAFPARESRHDA